MYNINSFISVKDSNLHFDNCSSCDGKCCNGMNGFALSPLILEDIIDVYENFSIVFVIVDNELKLFMILNDGNSYCKYYINNQCSIYDKRAPTCKLYPLSPFFDDILVDASCPSINAKVGQKMYDNNKINDNFYHHRLDNFNTKLNNTKEFLDSINKTDDLELFTTILNVPLFKYNKKSDNEFIQMHLDSLKNFNS